MHENDSVCACNNEEITLTFKCSHLKIPQKLFTYQSCE